MTIIQALDVFELLVNEAGADESWEGQFLAYVENAHEGEFRFQGKFGFGGKFYFTKDEWRVGYYAENATVPLDILERDLNRKLNKMYDER